MGFLYVKKVKEESRNPLIVACPEPVEGLEPVWLNKKARLDLRLKGLLVY